MLDEEAKWLERSRVRFVAHAPIYISEEGEKYDGKVL